MPKIGCSPDQGDPVMKTLLSSRPALWFLFLFNLSVAAIAPFTVEGAQGVATGVGMGVVSLGAGVALLRGTPATAGNR
jgi:hypothetical protein